MLNAIAWGGHSCPSSVSRGTESNLGFGVLGSVLKDGQTNDVGQAGFVDALEKTRGSNPGSLTDTSLRPVLFDIGD